MALSCELGVQNAISLEAWARSSPRVFAFAQADLEVKKEKLEVQAHVAAHAVARSATGEGGSGAESQTWLLPLSARPGGARLQASFTDLLVSLCGLTFW